MSVLALGKSLWKRLVAQEPEILLRNRYFETNPTDLTEQSAFLCRPGLTKWLDVGDGPIRAVYSQPGSFSDALFVASGDSLYRVDTDNTVTLIGGITGDPLGYVSMTATAKVGDLPAFLYIADGDALYLYMEDGYARGTLTATAIATTNKIHIGTTYYQWTSGAVDTGTPAGTNANPWLVALGGDLATSIYNLALALAAEGVAGVDYSTNVTANTQVTYQGYSGTTLEIRALDAGIGGDAIVTVVDSGAGITWGAATLQNGGDPILSQVQVPDDLGVISVGFIASYVIVVITQGQGFNGRWFWIEPGETIIRPLNFATAERSPDPLYQVLVLGDQFMLLGQATTEIWYPNGQTGIANDGTVNVPFSRVSGQLYDRGSWEGTAVQLKENLFIVDSDGAVFNIAGGLQRISNPGIEEMIRTAIQAERSA
jgi:hypothetical protein